MRYLVGMEARNIYEIRNNRNQNKQLNAYDINISQKLKINDWLHYDSNEILIKGKTQETNTTCRNL